MNIEKLKYPIGTFEFPKIIDTKEIDKWIQIIENFPRQLEDITLDLSTKELQFKYRPNSWSIQQLVHHCADSHMNSFIRFKLTLTEDVPVIKPYFEDRWAEQSDYLNCDISTSMQIIQGLHKRWVVLLKSLDANDLEREFIHPEHGKKVSLKENIGIYAWHCEHHLAHIKLALHHKI